MNTDEIREDIPKYGINDELVFWLLDEIDRLNKVLAEKGQK